MRSLPTQLGDAGFDPMRRDGWIRVRGARAHNLQNVNVDIPRNKLTVFTGISGSGKSSLAFDTIFAEGQRRYVESLSAYARMFLDQVDRPDVDLIEGLSPAVAIDQKSTNRNPRSTVGTITEIYDYMRLLWARIGIPHCTTCGARISRQSVQQIADELMALPAGTRYQLTAPIITGQKGTFADRFAELSAAGYARAIVDGEAVTLANPPSLAKQRRHDIAVVVDRLVASDDLLDRLTDSVETALRLADGHLQVHFVDRDTDDAFRHFSEHLACPNQHAVALTELEPRTFSFNAPYGACPDCAGIGTRLATDPTRIVGDDTLTIREGVLLPWAQNGGGLAAYFHSMLDGLANELEFSVDTPWRDLPETAQQAVLYGNDYTVQVEYRNRWGRTVRYSTGFEGVVAFVERKHTEAETDRQQQRWSGYLAEVPCQRCHGKRLIPAVLAVTVDGQSIADVTNLDLAAATNFFTSITLTAHDSDVSAQLLREILTRLRFLLDVGLDYLSLARAAATLSGGEAQRIRLATQIGAALTGVLYVLDEPSIGLHQRDNDRLIRILTALRDLGNTVLVVEHDEDTIRTADWIVDVGPGAGTDGGTIIHNGPLPQLLPNQASVTADYLTGRSSIQPARTRRQPNPERMLSLTGASGNNLRDVDLHLPLGVLTAVTGVSGSGKSTLINATLQRALANQLNGARQTPAPFRRLTGTEHLDKVVHVDQSPIGRTPRSNPATYTGVFDRIRNLFADTVEAKIRGYTAARFSFNVKGGRCESCQGDGTTKIEMNFLPDVYVDCDVCHGRRFNRDTLEVHYKGNSIADVLDMPISDAADFFAPFTIISRHLVALRDVGLGYVKLGQASTTLSGGEAQRIKLATELQRRTRGRNIYILDEPTTGLHFEDVRRLLDVLHELVNKGNTVVTIEHNLDVIRTADWVIDIGPEGGDGGGTILAEGAPENIARHPDSHTGRYLATSPTMIRNEYTA